MLIWLIGSAQALAEISHQGLSSFYRGLPKALQYSAALADRHQVFSSADQLLRYLLTRYERDHNIAENQRWRRISGWQQRHLLRPSTWDGEADNRDPRGYASRSGMADPAEDFISFGMAYFMTPESKTEDSIKCRMPKKFLYFKNLFRDYVNMLDKRGISCKTVDAGFLDDVVFTDSQSNQPIIMGPINANTIDGFELLYATPGTGDAAELAGHLLLRIKLNNNPAVHSLGLENPRDLVISFLADTAKPQTTPKAPVCDDSWLGVAPSNQHFDPIAETVQAIKGLTGGLLTLFNRATLEQTLRSYTYFQDRNLLRYRLNLTAQQKQSLIDHLYRVKKNFTTRYYFF